MVTNATQTIAEHVIERLRAVDYPALTERYAPDALLDVNRPAWRFQLQGPEAIREYFVEQTAKLSNLRCTQLRELVGDEIVEHTQYCTGYWAPDDIAHQSADAPMVRW